MFQLHGLQFRLVEIANRSAPHANHVMVWPEVRFDAQRAVVETDFVKYSPLEENPDVLIHGGQRYGRNLLPDYVVYPVRAGMSRQRHDRLINELSLMRGSQAMGAAQFTEFG